MPGITLVAATTNAGKLREFQLAAGQDFVIRPAAPSEPPEETGSTFEENAALKARVYSTRSSGLVFAEDSGLEVTALAGAPGIHSARWSGNDAANNRKLVEELQLADSRRSPDSPQLSRQARYVAVAALAREGELLGLWRGEVEGEIVLEPRGSGGFGYDPHFYYPPFACTFAECAPEEKLRVSHRWRALSAMFGWLRSGPHAV
jgi:XTP/dITP diphosphohydrolase